MTVPPRRPRKKAGHRPDYDGPARLALVIGTLGAAALIVWCTGSTSGFADLAALTMAVSAVLMHARRQRRQGSTLM